MYSSHFSSHEIEMFVLSDSETSYLVDLSQDVADILENIALPKCWRNDVTGLIVIQGDGDYSAVFVTESNTPWASSAVYHPLPYYMPSNRSKKNIPCYWQECNAYYQRND